MSASSDMPLDNRRKQVIFRANHRGIKEMDILLGGFATARAPSMGVAELTRFEAILLHPDQDLLAWLTGATPAPADIDQDMLQEIVACQKSRTEDS